MLVLFACVHQFGATLLHVAADSSHHAVVTYCVAECNMDVDARDGEVRSLTLPLGVYKTGHELTRGRSERR